MSALEAVFWVTLGLLVLLVAARVHGGVLAGLRAVHRASQDRQLRRLGAPALLTVFAGVAWWASGSASLDDGARRTVEHLLWVALGLGATWLAASFVATCVRVLLARYDMEAEDNLTARRAHTQYRVLLRIAMVVIWAFGLAVVLASFDDVRALGNGLLASAGLAGLVLGLAAQRTIGNFLAGIQIALTQPIRLDDAVVIDGEWGWIEDITTTYVVVKIWDERRLIVPFSKLLEQPFQNWTRTRADLLGSVTMWVDFTTPVQALREELQRCVRETGLWDGRVAVLQVVECSERAMQLRALVSAGSSPEAWDLRCHVRERLLAFVAREHPDALPSVRAELESSRRRRAARAAAAPAEEPGSTAPEVGGLPGEPVQRPADSEAPLAETV